MTDKKETFSYRVKRAWTGGPAVGSEISLEKPINSVLAPNVERIFAVKKAANDGEAVKLVDDAKAEAAAILDQARADAEGILSGAKAEATKLVDDAKVEAEKIVEDAKKNTPARR